MSKIRNLAGDTVIYGISTVAGRLLNFLLVPFYTRVFLPGEYGVVIELYAYITILMVLFTYGMETAFFRYADKSGSAVRTFSLCLYSLCGTALIMTGFILAGSGTIASLLGYQSNPEFIRWAVLILFFDTIAVIPFAWLRYQRKAMRFSIVKFLQIGLNIFFNLWFLVACPWMLENDVFTGLASFFYDSSIGAGYVLISNLLASVLIIPLFFIELRQLQPVFDFKLWKSMLLFSMPLVIVGLAGMVNEMTGRILLKHLLPYSQETNLYYLGIYGACYKLSIFMTLMVQAFRYAAEPFFFKEYGNKSAPELYARIMHYFVAGGMIVFLSISLFLDVIKHIISADYHEGIHIVPILLLANLFLGVFYTASVWYKVTGKTMAGAAIAVAGAFLTIFGNVLLIPVLGYTGSAVTTLVCYLSMSLISWYWGKMVFPIPYNLPLIIKLILYGVCFYLIFLLTSVLFDFSWVLEYFIKLISLLMYVTVVKHLLNFSISDILNLAKRNRPA